MFLFEIYQTLTRAVNLVAAMGAKAIRFRHSLLQHKQPRALKHKLITFKSPQSEIEIQSHQPEEKPTVWSVQHANKCECWCFPNQVAQNIVHDSQTPNLLSVTRVFRQCPGRINSCTRLYVDQKVEVIQCGSVSGSRRDRQLQDYQFDTSRETDGRYQDLLKVSSSSLKYSTIVRPWESDSQLRIRLKVFQKSIYYNNPCFCKAAFTRRYSQQLVSGVRSSQRSYVRFRFQEHQCRRNAKGFRSMETAPKDESVHSIRWRRKGSILSAKSSWHQVTKSMIR